MDSQSLPVLATDPERASARRPDSNFVRELQETHRSGHSTRRIFIGPMPEKVVAHMENQVKRQRAVGELTLTQLEDLAPEKSEVVKKVVKRHAGRFMEHYRQNRREAEARGEGADEGTEEMAIASPSARHRIMRRLRRKRTRSAAGSSGGHTDQHEDNSDSSSDSWDEDEEQNVVEDLLQKWKDSEWGKAWKHRHGKRRMEKLAPQHWLGGTFEVGTLFGVNLLEAPETRRRTANAVEDDSSILPDLTSLKSAPPALQPTRGLSSVPSTIPEVRSLNGQSNVDSETGLLTGARAGVNGSGTSEGASQASKGKQRVHYAESTKKVVSPPTPVPPEVVLSREAGDGLEPTSSQAAMFPSSAIPSAQATCGEALMRDRMLVRVLYSKLEVLNPKFDDSIHRTTRDLQFVDWGEFLAVWRKDYIELYEDHKMPGHEFLAGHKHLAHVIPLKCHRTNLSLYSFVDLSFCLTCPPTSIHDAIGSRRIFRRSKEGTNLFIFKHKNRSRAWDWTWHLWRYLGGEVPHTIDIHNPRLNSTVTIDIPYRQQIDDQELYAMFTRQNIVELCIASLRAVPDWLALAETELTQQGKRLELAWRRDANLDWLWLDEDIYGKSRPWATLAGLAVKQSSRPAALEIRLTSHAPTVYHVKDGKLEQPPSIEGYVWRIRPNTQTKQALYLSTHHGILFTHHPHEAYPPSPPGLALTMQDVDSWVKGLHDAEVLRGANQVLHATGVCDLQSIVAVRRAFQVVPPTHHQEKGVNVEDDSWFNIWAQGEDATMDDDEDPGGEAYVNSAPTREAGNVIRMRRCFELLLSTGNVIRFEAGNLFSRSGMLLKGRQVHTRRNAVEWVNRLRALISFWKHKRRILAKDEIELAQARRPRLTPQVRVCQEKDYPPEPPADLSAPYPAMEALYNWCIIDGCHPVTKVGKLHMRKGLRGPYKLFYVALVAGHLVRFRVKPGSSLHKASGKRTNLLDANVYSGYLAALNLPAGQFNPNQPAAPRRYLDGLETDDRDEDMMFVIWYRPHKSAFDAAQAPTFAPATQASLPALSAKERLLVFRSRSRIERDGWCWALNTEIEKMSRKQTVREEKMRDSGGLIDLK